MNSISDYLSRRDLEAIVKSSNNLFEKKKTLYYTAEMEDQHTYMKKIYFTWQTTHQVKKTPNYRQTNCQIKLPTNNFLVMNCCEDSAAT